MNMRMHTCQNETRCASAHHDKLILTYQIEAEDCEGHGAKEREHMVQGDEEVVQEGRNGRVGEHVEDHLHQPAD